ncbi:MAG TPA: SDR family NAD(P)-dependent oxidoreductase, partial [Candidatus Dormibacteraeota bacterium]
MAEGTHWLAGRVAVVTGASRGIGRATALAIAGEGAHVVVAARGAAALDATVSSIRDSGGQATAVPTDVGNASEIDKLFSVASDIGPPTALVCAAATLERDPFDEIS